MNTLNQSSNGRHRPLEDFIFYRIELRNKHKWRLQANSKHYLLDTPYTLSDTEHLVLSSMIKYKAIASKQGNSKGITYKEDVIIGFASAAIGMKMDTFKRNLEIIEEILRLYHLETLYNA